MCSTQRAELDTTRAELNTCKAEAAAARLSSQRSLDVLARSQHLFRRSLLAADVFINFTMFDDHFYVIFAIKVSHNVTLEEEECEKLGGYLVEFENSQEYDLAIDFISKSVSSSYGVMVGYTDAGSEGRWRYMHSNTPIKYARWASGEPDSGTSANWAFIYTSNKEMYDNSHTGQLYYLCEVP